MDDWTPLNIYSDTRPTPEQLEKLKAAKRASGVTAKCKPVRAVAGCGRAISFQGRPPFAVEWVEPWDYDDEDLPAMLKWVLTGEGYVPYTVEQWLRAIDPGFKEVTHG